MGGVSVAISTTKYGQGRTDDTFIGQLVMLSVALLQAKASSNSCQSLQTSVPSHVHVPSRYLDAPHRRAVSPQRRARTPCTS